MPKGGLRHPGPGKRLGRPRSEARTIDALRAEVEVTIAEFRETVKSSFLSGVTKMASRFPLVVDRLVHEAEHGNVDAQKFIVEKFLRFFQPDLVIASETPVSDFLRRLRSDLGKVEPSALGGGDAQPTPVIEGQFGEHRNEGSVRGELPVQTGDGGREVG